jgi:copper oxidase (laccase) domain-containing protein
METLGASPDRITAAIGPTISQANYEVGEDLCDRFASADSRFFAAGRAGHFQFDLPGYVFHRLRQAGVRSVENLGLCTYPPANGFFSYRRATHLGEADYGREISGIVIVR